MNQQPQQPRHEQYGPRGQFDQQPQQHHEQFDRQPQQQQGPVDQQPQQQQGPVDQQAPQQRGQYDQQSRQRGPIESTQQPTEGQGMQPSLTHSFRDHLTDELRIALEDFNELAHVAAWCATECASAGIGTCARICQDLAEIAELNEMLIARDSMFGSEIAETFVRVGRDALPELRQYQQRHPHIVETVSTLERTMNACSTLLEMGSRGGQQTGTHAGGQRSKWQEPGGQHLPQQSSGRAQHPRF